jgi:hypothetical protein
MFAPSLKQATGHTLTQSVNLHLIHGSQTTNVIEQSPGIDPPIFSGLIFGLIWRSDGLRNSQMTGILAIRIDLIKHDFLAL